MVGEHRYGLMLFRQQGTFSEEQIEAFKSTFECRSPILASKWANEQGMAVPVSFNLFTSEWSESVDVMHENMGFLPPSEFQSPSQQLKGATSKETTTPVTVTIPSNHPMYSFGVTTNVIFDGGFLNKKYGNEILHRSRFCWIDKESKRFFWSKVKGKDDPKKKSLSLKDDIKPDGITLAKTKIIITHISEKTEETINLEIVGNSDNVLAASEWYKVLTALATE